MSKNIMVAHKAIEKINEIIELLNAITIDVDGTKCVDGSKASTDPYAEQRKWIGKLCWFWTFRRENAIIGLLTDFEIDEPRFRMDELGWYEHCEPVKPDDDIIYKGGDNE